MAHPVQPPSASDRESHSCKSRLLQVLEGGHFAVTAELNAPDSADPKDVCVNILAVGDVCDGISATDGSGANCHMSSVGCCALMARGAMSQSCRLVAGTATALRFGVICWGRQRTVGSRQNRGREGRNRLGERFPRQGASRSGPFPPFSRDSWLKSGSQSG